MWANDPYSRHQLRYFDGSRWTDHVSDHGVVGLDQVPSQTVVARPAPADEPRVLTRLRKAKYLGSHPRVPRQAEDLDLVFTTAGITFQAGRANLGDIPWSSIHELVADTSEGVERRLTGTRLLLLGAFALVAKKETLFSYLIVRDAHGEWIFAIPGLSAIELRSGLNPLRVHVPSRTAQHAQPSAPVSSPADRLRRLSELAAEGLLTEAEHAAKRQLILDEL